MQITAAAQWAKIPKIVQFREFTLFASKLKTRNPNPKYENVFFTFMALGVG